ncbi:hypothetical protein GCM10027187_07840 [Streptosporangium sandarakinum]|uniref:Uncharacterized protein n=1 Tax=Streptosporangium sandarakinum TaxID=1260955 RepID=A0A852UWN8_9ACTN|nr:hypothetical protein [Streptosporangium sandarakinum]NYF42087.1 hypothetical protein [Streptosporangium sandarakinum]
MTGHEIGFEWALEGKRPGAHNDYELLSWSDGRLGPEVFEEIRNRFATGLSADLPQLTVAVAATRERERVSRHVVLAIQEWSGHRDATNRKIAYTRWFYVPYEELAAHRVSYEALYHALARLPVTPSAPPVVRVPDSDPAALDPGPDARCAAALLLTGRPVCVVGADGVPMVERLRFLDTVAALLPYGMRTRLTAATWVSSTARHRIRLSFARHAPRDAYEVGWGRGTEVAWRDSPANVYLDLLTRTDVRIEDMMEGLARDTEPLSFGPGDLPRAVRLLERSGYPEEVLSSADAEADTEWEAEGPGAVPAGTAGLQNAAPGVGEPVPAGGGAPWPDAARPALEPGEGRGAGEGREAGEGRPTSPVSRLTSLIGTPWRRLGLGSGGTRAVRPPGATLDTAPGSRTAPPLGITSGSRAAPAIEPATGSRAAPTMSYQPAAVPGPGAMPPSMQDNLGGLKQADHAKRPGPAWGPHGRLTLAAAFMALAVTLIAVGAVAMVSASGGDPPAEKGVTGTEPDVVVVQVPAGQRDAFARHLVAEAVRRAGHRPEVRLSDTPAAAAPAAEPAVVLMAPPPPDPVPPDGAAPAPPVNPLAAQGFSEVATVPVPDPYVLVYDAARTGPDDVAAALTSQDGKARVSVPDASPDGLFGENPGRILRDRYPRLKPRTVPAADPLRDLRKGEVQAALVPREVAGGYSRSEALSEPPDRSLLVLANRAVGRGLRDALGEVARSVDPGKLVSAGFDSPAPAAVRLVESVLPPPAAPRSADQEDDRERDDSQLALILIVGGAVIGFLALLLAIRLPSRIEPH